VFDVRGRRVRTLLDLPDARASRYEVEIDGRSDDGRLLGPGVYLYRVQTAERSHTGRFAIIR
jgi:hypothetical protein